jgi:hypothetical protein
MEGLVFDLEGDGLLDDITTIHCIVAKDISDKKVYQLYGDSLTEDAVLKLFNRYDYWIGHNIIGYDLPVLKRFYGLLPHSKGLIDTLVWSQVLNPDRQLPKGCPSSYKNPLTNRLDRIGPHSLAAWGYRVGRFKPEHYDWSSFSEEMLHRCTEDVLIQEKVLYEVQKEARLEMYHYD